MFKKLLITNSRVVDSKQLVPMLIAIAFTTGFWPISGVYAQFEGTQTPPPANQIADFTNEKSILKDKGHDRSALSGVGSENSQTDHKAKVFDFGGDVRILKKGTQLWIPVQKWMTFEEGDKLRTGKESFIEITYDDFYLNIARVEENTIGEFRSIEPTDLFLEDGTVFSALDGLKPGQSYQISTPVAVAAVRGTHYLVSFAAIKNEFFTATIPVKEDDHNSLIEVTGQLETNKSEKPVPLPEGFEMHLGKGEMLTENLVIEISPETLARAQAFAADMSDNREIPKETDQEDNKNGIMQPPNGGGGTGGTGSEPGNSSGAMNAGVLTEASRLDAFVDKALETNTPLPQDLLSTNPGDFASSGENEDKTLRPDFSKALEFAKIGGLQMNESNDIADLKDMVTAMGFSEQRIDSFIDRMENYFEAYMNTQEAQNSGDFNGDSGFFNSFDGSMPLPEEGESYDGSYSGDFDSKDSESEGGSSNESYQDSFNQESSNYDDGSSNEAIIFEPPPLEPPPPPELINPDPEAARQTLPPPPEEPQLPPPPE